MYFLEKLKHFECDDNSGEDDLDPMMGKLLKSKEVTLLFTARDTDLVYYVSDKLLDFSKFSKVQIKIRFFLTGDAEKFESGDAGLKMGNISSDNDKDGKQASFKLLQQKGLY